MSESKVVRAVVTLTTSESKRLIGKAVANLDVVRKALKEGIIVIAVGTTDSFVAEEITGTTFDKEHFSMGVITPKGLSMTSFPKQLPHLLVRRGEVSQIKSSELKRFCDQLGPKDVIIKGANAIDHIGNAAVLAVDPAGGTIGAVWNALTSKSVKLVVPVGLEKTVPFSLLELKKRFEESKVRIWRQMGLPPARMFLLEGQIVTELVAFRILSNVEAMPIASGGVGGAEGSITVLLEGSEENVSKAWELSNKIKGEPPVKADTMKLS